MKVRGRKIYGFILSILMIVPLITMNPVKAESTSHKVYELSAKENASVGDTIDVDLKVYPKDNLSSFQLSVNYDDTAFRYEDYDIVNTLGSAVDCNEPSLGKVKIACAKGKKLKENTKDESYLILKFKVLNAKAALGNHDFKLNITHSYNINEEKMDFSNEIMNTQISVDAPLKDISMSQKNIEINKGESQTITVNKVPEFTTNKDSVQWASADPSIVSVDSNGKLTAIKGGKTQITASIGTFKATCNVTVTVPLESISIDPVEKAIDVGSQKQLTVKYLPEDTTVNKKVTWKSLDKSIATVDESGIVTAVKRGKVKIEATMAGKTAIVDINVRQPLVKISINEKDFELIKNKNATLTVTEDPSVHDDEIDKKVWSSSNNKIATVDQTGKVKALKEGKAIISVTYYIGSRVVTASVTVSVKEIHVSKVELNKTKVEMQKNDEDSLKATYLPLDTTDDTTVTWSSSNDKIVTVDKIGNIKAVGGGTAQVTASIGTVKATCDITVNVPLESISIDPIKEAIDVGKQKRLTVKYLPEDTTVNKKVTWKSLDTTIATVDENGIVTALKRGTVKIEASLEGKKATVDINIRQPLIKISINENDFELIKNKESSALTVTENPSVHDDIIDKKVWSSSDNKIATVDQIGKVKALKEGKVDITITYYIGDRKVSDSITVSVKEIHINKVELNKTKINMVKNDLDVLEATYSPLDTTDDTTVVWSSSNDKIVTVDKNGNIKAIGGGTATITATIANKKAECTVNVKVPLVNITLTGDNEILKGQTKPLTINKVPSDATEKLLKIKYESSDTSVAKVDKDGKVTGIKEGTVEITVSGYVDDRYYEAKHSMTVKEIKLQSIQIDLESPRVILYTTQQAKVIYNPSNTTDDKAVVWTSSDPTIASIDKEGHIKGLKPGKTTITVTSEFNEKFTDEIEIEVYEIPIESISLDKTSLELTVDDTYQCKAIVLPENTTDSKKLTWESSDEEVATVDDNGKITAFKKGTAIITVSAKNGEVVESLQLKVVNKKIKPTYDLETKDIKLSVSQDQLQDIYKSVSDDFKAIVDDGGKLEVVVKSEAIKDKEILTQLNNQLALQGILKDYQVGKWVNIEVIAEVTSPSGDEVQTEVLSELLEKLKIKVEIPQEILAKNRDYSIVRIHDGNIEILQTELSADGKYLIFESDKYSEFAIIYKDKEITNDDKQNPSDQVVHTDDTTLIGMELMGMVFSGIVIAFCYKKKKYL